MRSIIVLFCILAAGNTALAQQKCPDLSGKYSCELFLPSYGLKVPEQRSISQTDKEIKLDSDTFLTDGKWHRAAFYSRYNVQCSQSKLTMNFSAVSVNVQKVYEKDSAGVLKIKTYSDGKPTGEVATCKKIK